MERFSVKWNENGTLWLKSGTERKIGITSLFSNSLFPKVKQKVERNGTIGTFSFRLSNMDFKIKFASKYLYLKKGSNSGTLSVPCLGVQGARCTVVRQRILPRLRSRRQGGKRHSKLGLWGEIFLMKIELEMQRENRISPFNK